MFAMHLSRNDRSRTYMSTGPDNKRMPGWFAITNLWGTHPLLGSVSFHELNN